MSGASIEAPYTIASVPVPLDTSHGRIQAAPVYSVKGSNKRKRLEVTVGIDGEGVNIYSVPSHSLVTSYALPPQSHLCCPPASVYIRPTGSTVAQRRTFVVIKDGVKSSKRRLLSFTEDVSSKKTTSGDFTGPERRGCKLQDGEILSLDLIPYRSNEQLSVLVNYRNGGIMFISGDLSKTHWEEPPAHGTDDNYVVEYAAILDAGIAKNGILKGREDVIGLIEQATTQAPGSTVFCRMTRSNGERRLELYTLRDPTGSSIQTANTASQLLMSYVLPISQERSANAAQYELDFVSGRLFQLLDSKLNVYNLSGTVPRVLTEVGGGVTPLKSFVRISKSSVLAFSKGNTTLFETSFGSVQASLSMPTPLVSGPKGKKRKRDEPDSAPLLEPICAFPDTGLIVSLFGNDVMAFQITGRLHESKTRGSHGTLLKDVIGKGNGANEMCGLERHQHEAKAWEEWTTKIDALISEDDIEGLERLVASDPKLGRQRKEHKRDRASGHHDLPNGQTTPYDDLWPLPESFDPNAIDRRKVLYILRKVFDYSGHEYGLIEIRMPSLKLVEWLALTGFLSSSYLEKAFQTNPSRDQALNTIVKPGDIMIAIRQIDDDFQTIRDLLSLPVQWEVAEVVQALRFAIESFDATPTEEPLLALPAPPAESDGDVEMVNGDAESQDEIESESKAAENELDFVMNALTSGLEVRSDLLRVIILRLHAFPSSAVTATMRSMMSPSEIIFFIHILRIELADGGWTSKYVDAGDDEVQDRLVNAISGEDERGGPSDQAIRAIGDLLNCAVDAMGTSGWLVGQSSSALRTDELIESLRAEVSAGLEGCYEASTLETLLLELEKCAASVGKSRRQIARHQISHDEINSEQSLLPLGSRTEPPIIPGRNEKDRKKTKMAIGREKSRRVGKYSLDRIRI